MEDVPSEGANRTLGIPAVIFLLFIALAALVFVIAVGSSSSIKRTSWTLAEAPFGNVLQIDVQVGGCDVFARTSVAETDAKVVVEAYIRDGALAQCPAGIFFERKSIQLQAPLADRALHGCSPPSAVYGPGSVSNTDCAASVR